MPDSTIIELKRKLTLADTYATRLAESEAQLIALANLLLPLLVPAELLAGPETKTELYSRWDGSYEESTSEEGSSVTRGAVSLRVERSYYEVNTFSSSAHRKAAITLRVEGLPNGMELALRDNADATFWERRPGCVRRANADGDRRRASARGHSRGVGQHRVRSRRRVGLNLDARPLHPSCMFSLAPVAFVRAARTTPEDDDWGGTVSVIELAEDVRLESLVGLDAFSHVGIVYVFDRVTPDQSSPARGIRAGIRAGRRSASSRSEARTGRIGSVSPSPESCAWPSASFMSPSSMRIDGTPMVDIKPVIREFLPRGEVVQPAWASELMATYWRTVRSRVCRLGRWSLSRSARSLQPEDPRRVAVATLTGATGAVAAIHDNFVATAVVSDTRAVAGGRIVVRANQLVVVEDP